MSIDEFSELMHFNAAQSKHEKLGKSAKLSTIEQFIYNSTEGHVYRIYGWISQYSKKAFSVIDGSGELKGIRFAGFKAELTESDLFEFVCLDLKQVKAEEN